MEHEVTGPVALCVGGALNPAAVGWSRTPLHDCAITGAWGRRKRWHHWAVTSRAHVAMVTVADLDYVGIASVAVVELGEGKWRERVAVRPLGWRGVALPERASAGAFSVHAMGLRVAIEDNAGGARLLARGQGFELDLKVTRPVGHQTLNIALPLSDGFQFTSKQAALPAEGEVRVGRHVVRFAGRGDDALACLDYGRGVWPYRTEWNWAAAHGRVGAHMLGLNLGGRWTDFGGVTENGLVVDGVLHKIEERVVFDHDGDDVRRPWRIHGPGVAVTVHPCGERKARLPLGLASARLEMALGHFEGRVLDFDVSGLFGWAEEFHARW